MVIFTRKKEPKGSLEKERKLLDIVFFPFDAGVMMWTTKTGGKKQTNLPFHWWI
jgi:hypothetical protein